MSNLIHSARLVLFDMASTFVFLGVIMLTKNVPLAIGSAMALGVVQLGWQVARKKPVGTMQWLSFILVLCFGTISLLTHDPRFVMAKPSLISLVIGAVMLKPGWMNRYLPPIAQETVPDVAFVFGYIWAAMQFFTAGLNLVLALKLSPLAWSEFMSVYGLASTGALFAVQFAVMRIIGARRRRTQMTPALA
jgi:intracellular septation protein